MTIGTRIVGGVDTHLDTHVAAALDERGALLGVESFDTTPAGYGELLEWMRQFGEVELVGVEGTGSYGAGLTRHLHTEGVRVVEVDRPNRQRRRSRGKSDPQDAISAARAAQSGDCCGEAKTRNGNVETMRVLRIARNSARRSRTQALNQMRSIISTAPDEIRSELRDLNVHHMLKKASTYRPRNRHNITGGTRWVLRTLAKRSIGLEAEVKEIDQVLKDLVADTAPDLVARPGLGTDTTSALLVAAGDNPQRLRNEGSFAHLCGVAPVDANTGKQLRRHRLNRGGDRQANSALWHIVITRMVCDQTTRDYIERRTTEDGLTKKEAIRCLKRHIAREIYHYLPRPQPAT